MESCFWEQATKKHLLLVCLAHVYLKIQRPAFPFTCSETKAHNVSVDGSQRAHPKSKDKFPFQMPSDTVRHTHRDTVFMHMPCVCVVHSPAIRSQLHRCFCNGELIPVSVCVESGFWISHPPQPLQNPPPLKEQPTGDTCNVTCTATLNTSTWPNTRAQAQISMYD